MAVKMLTTKKHSKTAKAIDKIKEENKPIEVVKTPKKVVEPKAKKKVKTNKLIQKEPIVFEKADPKNMLEKLITKRQYDNALRVIKQYEKEKGLQGKNGINLYKEISVRVANRLCVYFREKGIELDMANFDVAYLKHINLSEINQMRNFGKGSLYLLKEYLEKQK
jgi:hypothetical protein